MFQNLIPDMYQTQGGVGTYLIITLLKICLPLFFIYILIFKALKFAVASSDKAGEWAEKAFIGGTKATLALGVAAVTGGASLAAGLSTRVAVAGAAAMGRAIIGRKSLSILDSEKFKKWEAQGGFGTGLARKALTVAGSSSFDVRETKSFGKVASIIGLKSVGTAQKGGYKERREREVEKRQKRATNLKVGGAEPLQQKLNKTEEKLQKLFTENANTIKILDTAIDKKKKEAEDAARIFNQEKGTKGEENARKKLKDANAELRMAEENKKDFRKGGEYMTTDANGKDIEAVGTKVDIDALEKQKREQEQEIGVENAKRMQEFAKAQQSTKSTIGRLFGFVLSGGAYNKEEADEAAHKIIMETKLDSGTKT